jgi:hypothetical protein
MLRHKTKTKHGRKATRGKGAAFPATSGRAEEAAAIGRSALRPRARWPAVHAGTLPGQTDWHGRHVRYTRTAPHAHGPSWLGLIWLDLHCIGIAN